MIPNLPVQSRRRNGRFREDLDLSISVSSEFGASAVNRVLSRGLCPTPSRRKGVTYVVVVDDELGRGNLKCVHVDGELSSSPARGEGERLSSIVVVDSASSPVLQSTP